MWKLSMSIIEVIILLYVISVINKKCRGYFNPNPSYVMSNPVVGAAIGNAANRHFENSQAMIEPSSQQIYYPSAGNYSNPSLPMFSFPKKGYAQGSPENLVAWANN